MGFIDSEYGRSGTGSIEGSNGDWGFGTCYKYYRTPEKPSAQPSTSSGPSSQPSFQPTVFSLDRIGTYFSEKFVTTRSSGISSVPTRQIMPTRSTAVPTRSATA